LAGQREMVIDDTPVFLEHFHRDVADGRRGRDAERRLHVLHDLRRGAAKGDRVAGWKRRRWDCRRYRHRSLWGGGALAAVRRRGAAAPLSNGNRLFREILFELRLVVAEELAPGGAHRV